MLHSEAVTGLPDRNATTSPMRVGSGSTKPIRSRRGPIVVFAMLLLITIATQFSMSFLKIDAVPPLRSGFGALAVLIAVYVAALLAIFTVIERRRRTRSRSTRQPVIE